MTRSGFSIPSRFAFSEVKNFPSSSYPVSSNTFLTLFRHCPQWRNKVKKVFDETGYELDGKFLTSEKANRLGMENPDLVMKFRKGVRRWQDRNHSQLTERSS